ncbi:MAG: phage tail assembly protein [Clostridia bacterium]|nr:phage tail assembly protein [Clostridia bacterium]
MGDTKSKSNVDEDIEVKDTAIAVQEEKISGEVEDNDLLVHLSKPYKFDGDTYTEVNLAALDTMNTNDMVAGEKWIQKHGIFAPAPEMNTEYCCYMAARATNLPIEFFKGLPLKDAAKIRGVVGNFIMGQD